MPSVNPRTALMIAGLMILISQSPLIEYNSYTTSGNEPVLDDTDEQLFVGEQHDVSLVKDIKVETGHAGAPGSGQVAFITKMGNHLYFRAEDTHANGAELWKSDGTASGTIMLKDICPQVNCDGYLGPGATLGYNQEMTVIGNTLYFAASSTYCTSSCSTELWKTDGTTSGTVMVKAFDQGGLKYMTPVGNTLFFQADDSISGRELWKSDGTESGTMMVKDINTEISDLGSSPYGLTPIGNTLFFQADDGINGQAQLWKSDGTETGTVQVLNLSVTSGGGLIAIGDTLFFWGNNGTYGHEPWKYDTASPLSASNPIMVKDITSGSGSTSSNMNLRTVVGNTLYFTVGISSDSVLWKTDGTESGTVKVNPVASADTPKSLGEIHKVGNKIFFGATKNTQWSNGGAELWTSDGTANGTYLVKDICPGYCQGSPHSFFTLGDIVFFSANDGSNGTELWRSDGTESGTMMVQDINPGGGGSGINGNFVLLGDTLYFSATNSTYGADELWRMTNVTGNPAGSASISPHSTSVLLNVDEEMTPITFDWVGGPGNGTTWVVADINNGSADNIQDTIVVGTRLFFTANDGTHGDEMWTHETTNDSTWMVADIRPGSSSNPGNYIAVGTRIFFAATNDSNDRELWAHEMSNGSTWRVTDINSGGSSGPYPLSALGTRLFFVATNDSNDRELWAHEMSNGSTWMVGDINTGGSSSVGWGIAVGTRFYFNAADGGTSCSGGDLWAYEVTNESFWKVEDSNNGGPKCPTGFNSMGTRIYFSALNESGHAEIWAHETTNETTWEVTNVSVSSSGWGYNQPHHITVIGSQIIFTVITTGGGTYETLWIHDTTNDTTWNASLIDISWSDTSQPFANVGTQLFFQIDTASNGGELGAFEITNESSWMVEDIWSGAGHGSPNHMVVIGNTLYFQAANDTHANGGISGLYAHSVSGGSGSAGSTGTSSGNGTVWQVPGFGYMGSSTNKSNPGLTMDQGIVVGDTIYFDAETTATGIELWAHDNSNHSTWQVADINQAGIPEANDDSSPGYSMEILVGDTIYFSAYDGITNGQLWAHDTSNTSTWKVTNIGTGYSTWPGQNMYLLVGDTLYFDAYNASTGRELWAHDTSNHSTWQVADINNGTDSGLDSSMFSGLTWSATLVGDTIYFAADDGTDGIELWAHDTSNSSTWQVIDIKPGSGWSSSSIPGLYMSILVGDTLYFDAEGSSGNELWAHDTSNSSTWQVADINSGNPDSSPGTNMEILVGDTIYFDALGPIDGKELWAHDTSNHSTWQVADIDSATTSSAPGWSMGILVGDTLYFDADDGLTYGRELWAHDTSNSSTWQVADIKQGGGGSSPGWKMGILVGDTLYFSADGVIGGISSGTELWAHDTSNSSTWRVADIHHGGQGSLPGDYMEILVGDTLYFDAEWAGSSTKSLVAFGVGSGSGSGSGGPSNGPVTSATCDISPTLPAGLTLTQGTCTISGTPTESQDNTNYILWINESGVLDAAFVSIEVQDPEQIDLSPDDITTLLTNNTTMSPMTFNWIVSGIGASGPESGPVANATCEISPALSAGLSMAQGTCTISGTPTATQSSTVYTLWVNQSGVSDTATIDITVQEMLPDPPSISPESVSITLMRTVAIGPISFTNIGGDIDTWEVYPALPDGLLLSTSGTISGIPTTVQAAGVYDIWANNTGGSDYAIVTITVEEYIPDPPEISYTSSVVLTQYLQMTPIVPTNTGGVADTWEISPALSPGLILSADGTISGTPTTVESGIVYTIWANNTGGSDSATQIITVEIAPDGLSTSSPSILLVRDGTMLPWYFNYNGENITTWEISPDLPPGLIFDIASKSIYGTPTEMMVATTFTIWANGSEISESINVTIEVLDDTDGDGMPDSLGSHTNTGLIEDLDDDADGISDVDEFASTPATDSLLPDTDGDGICDGSINVTIRDVQICEGGPDAFPTDPSAWEDTDGDGDPDNIEGNSTSEPPLVEDLDDDGDGIPDENESAEGSLTDSLLPDTDGDGVCDGAINVTYGDDLICTGGPDAFPADPTEWVDTDGDEIGNNADLDDDGDQASDLDELAAGTDPLDPLDFPTDDADGDGWTDAQEDFCGTDKLDNTSIPADNDADLWCDSDDPDDDNDGWFDTSENDCDTDPLDVTSVPSDTDGDGICDKLDSVPQDDNDDGGFQWWLCSLLFLALIIILPLIMRLVDDAMPENTRVRPEVSGAGTRDDPFILTPTGGIEPGESVLSEEIITITKMTPELKVHIIDLKEKENGRKFLMVDEVLSDERVKMIVATEDGTMDFRMSFSDSFNPTPGGGTFQSTLKVGRNSVYFMWDVTVKSDPNYVKSVVKPSTSDTTVVSLQMNSEEDEKPAKKYAEYTSESDENKGKVVVIKEKIHSMLDRDGDGELTLSDVKTGAIQAGQTVKKGAVKVGKTVKKGAEKTKEKVVAAKDKTHEYLDQKKAKKEAEAAEAEAIADEAESEAKVKKAAAKTRVAEAEARAAEAEADARVAEAEARTAKAEAKAKKAAEDVPLTKEEKKAAGLERVKANAAKIDFGTIGIATMSEKDDLQVVKGIGPFIEEKLNALGIYTFQQISKMSSDLEEQVNEAIEFFPGRVKRDQWVSQCKTLLNDE